MLPSPHATTRPAPSEVSTTAARSREGHAHVDDDLAVGERDERDEPVDHGELARHAVGDVGVRGGDPRVVLADRRLRPGDDAQEVGPEPVALRRHAADGHQRRAALDGRPQRGQGRERPGRLGTVDDDRVVLGEIRERLAGADELDVAEALGERPERRGAVVREAGRQDQDAHRGNGITGAAASGVSRLPSCTIAQ